MLHNETYVYSTVVRFCLVSFPSRTHTPHIMLRACDTLRRTQSFEKFKTLYEQHIALVGLKINLPTQATYDLPISPDGPHTTSLAYDHRYHLTNDTFIVPTTVKAKTISLLVVQLVCDVLAEEMDPKEGLMGLPKAEIDTCIDIQWGAAMDRESRNMLRNMSPVHRDWTKAAQTVLQRRISTEKPLSFMRFLWSSLCGPRVREMQICFDEEEKLEDIFLPWQKETINSLRSKLQNATRLRALSIAIKPRISQDLKHHVYLTSRLFHRISRPSTLTLTIFHRNYLANSVVQYRTCTTLIPSP